MTTETNKPKNPFDEAFTVGGVDYFPLSLPRVETLKRRGNVIIKPDSGRDQDLLTAAGEILFVASQPQETRIESIRLPIIEWDERVSEFICLLDDNALNEFADLLAVPPQTPAEGSTGE